MPRTYTSLIIKTFIFLSITLNISKGISQDIITEVPSSITVCHDAESFSITIKNETASSYLNPKTTINLPNGLEYINNSLNESTAKNVQQFDITSIDSPIFSSNTIAPGDSISFSIEFKATAAAIDFLLNGNTIRNSVEFNHDGGAKTIQSNAYNLLYAALNITKISPTSKSLKSGENFTRTITIVNAGYGKLSEFTITDVRPGTNLVVSSTDIGTLENDGETITLSGSDFNTIGNGDDYFDSNESITITETLDANGCDNITITSTINAHWGCNGTTRSTSNSSAHATISYKTPNLNITINSELSSCFASGEASPQEMIITNSGQGIAKSVILDVFKSSGGAYDESLFSRLDEGSFQYKVGNGSFQSITPTTTYSTQSNGDYSCLGSNAVGRAILNLPDIDAGEEITLTWNMFHCAIDVCEDQKVKGWEYELDYDDVCIAQSYNKDGTGEASGNHNLTLFTETPTDINDGETESFTYTISSFSNELPEGDDSYYEVIFDLPIGLVFSNNSSDLTYYSGTNTWEASYMQYDANARTVTARYTLPAPFLLPKSEFTINLTGDCSQAGASEGTVNIITNMYYVPDASCSPEVKIPFACDYSTDINLHCPSGPCEGLRFLSYDINRTSLGSPDNDQNGLADASGNIDLSKIKTNRAMVGDTLQAIFNGTIGTSITNNTWSYGYATTTIELGKNLTSIGATVRVYDASQNTYSTSNATASSQISGDNQSFSYDFSSLPDFEEGDSIWVYANYKVTGNIGGKVQEVKATNSFYVSNQENPTQNNEKYQCGYYNGKFTLIGYYFSTFLQNNYSIKSCSQIISQDFALSIGDCCSNYEGGNLFPYEYRNWAHVKQARVEIPAYYEILDMYVKQRRTKTTNSSTTQTVNGINYSNRTGNTLLFDLEQYYKANGGTIDYSDDGFRGTLYLVLAPSCDVPNNTYQDINWEFTFEKSNYLGAGETDWMTNSPDRIKFNPTDLQISSTNPIIDGLEKTVTWNVKIANTTNKTDASNAWIHLKNPSGDLEIVSIVDVSTGETLSLTSDIYTIESINRNKSKNFLITAKYNACNVDKFWVYTGYECAGYPSSFSAFKCNYSQMELRVEPKPAELQSLINGNTIGEQCSNTVEVIVEVASVKLATADSVKVSFSLPSSLTYVASSSELKYPLTGGFGNISDPSNTGSTYTFSLNDYSTIINTKGLPGVLNLDSNKFQVKFQVNMEDNFQPGDFVAVAVDGQEVCGKILPTINMAYDPSVKFEKNVTSGLSNNAENNWSIAWVDYNHDGKEDVFVTNYNKEQANQMYKNNGDGSFSSVNIGEITSDLISSVSSTWGDYDNDGNIDVFIANNIGSSNNLYHNNGNGTFSKVGNQVNDGVYSHNASWADYDKDGYLDLFVSEYMPTKFNLLYHNNGDGTFTSIKNTPITQEASYSIGATWGDYDNDGDVDLFVPNTEYQTNSLYRNEGGGSFTKITTGAIVTDQASSVGSSWGDYNNDGYLDLFVANAGNQNNNLYQNNGDGTFTKIISGPVVNDGGHSHGSAWGDMDNDGDLDLFVTNDQDNPNFLYTNNGNGTFTKFENIINTDISNSFGTAFGDYDNDGDLDLFVANRSNEENDFYTNGNGSCNSWTCFTLTGSRSNKSAIGAKVKVKATIYGNSIWQTREISSQTGGGAGGQSTLKVLFGLGNASSIDSITIIWPSGIVQHIDGGATMNDCNNIIEENGVAVSGKVFHDENQNCIYDDGELLMSNTTIEITPGPYYATTNAQGEYTAYLKEGDYDLHTRENDYWESICSSTEVTHDVTIAGTLNETHTGLDFPVIGKTDKPDVTVTIGASVLRRGFLNTITLAYTNLGAFEARDVTLSLTMHNEIIPVGSDIPWDSQIDTTLTWNLGTLAINEGGIITIDDSVDLFAILGEWRIMEATISSSNIETNYDNNTASATEEIVGSVDPNDKQVFPRGYGPAGLITKEDTLTYKIRFQNVGNYEAWRVIIIDTLSKYLDYTSIHDVTLSHDMGVYSISDEGIFTIRFTGINLPDSIANEPESHGFVQFKILIKAECPNETPILNSAGIQFDYNEFIHTNTVFNTVVGNINDQKILQLVVYPNPTSSLSRVKVISRLVQHLPIEIKEISIYDISGAPISNMKVEHQDEIMIYADDLAKGVYFIKAKDQNGFWYATNMMVY